MSHDTTRQDNYDTRQDNQAQRRYDEPVPDDTRDEPRPGYEAPAGDEARYGDEAPAGEEARDEASPRYDPPAWHDAEPATAGPSDLDAAEPEPESPEAGAVAPADTAPPPQAVDTGAPAVAVATAPVESAEDPIRLWPEDTVHDLQQRWREVQLRFVDDPRAAADEAQELVTEALERFSETVAARKGELDGWRNTDGADTERMRTVVRQYRKLLDGLLGV